MSELFFPVSRKEAAAEVMLKAIKMLQKKICDLNSEF